ncbi:MAG: YdcF family protein [Alphaproteobacteria bacterium]|nr:YdcF family protein [Alphaproteobacteria bacterium]
MTIGQLVRGIGVGAVAIACLWLGGFLWFASALDHRPLDAATTTDAVVVLTGGSERLEAGFAILAQGRAKKLFISGVGKPTSRAEIRSRAGQVDTLFDCCVVIGRKARDTAGNALETAVWMEAEGFRSLRLVTGGYHMPRSLVEFERLMPGIGLIPHPVFPERVKIDRWWEWPGTTELIAGEYTKYLFALARLRLAPPRSEPRS